MQNVNDRKREQAAKPSAGVIKIHEGKEPDNYACPNSGGTVHADKAVDHERGNVANPSASGPRPTDKDKKNQATPSGGTVNERQDQKKFDENHDELKRKRL
jgi:hypothetical protein